MKKGLIGGGIVLAAIIGIALFLVINVNSVVKNAIEVAGPEILGVDVSVDSVDISFFSGAGSISGLKVGNPEGYESAHAITIDKLSLELDPASLNSDKIHIRKIIVDQPSITYEGNLVSSNIQTLQQASAGSSETSGSGTDANGSDEPQNLQIDSLQINDARIGVHLKLLENDLSLVLPSLELTDLGKDDETSVADVINNILGALNKSLIPLIRENASGVNDKLKEATKKVSDKLKGLFK